MTLGSFTVKIALEQSYLGSVIPVARVVFKDDSLSMFIGFQNEIMEDLVKKLIPYHFLLLCINIAFPDQIHIRKYLFKVCCKNFNSTSILLAEFQDYLPPLVCFMV